LEEFGIERKERAWALLRRTIHARTKPDNHPALKK
jgi:hypothetical protein